MSDERNPPMEREGDFAMDNEGGADVQRHEAFEVYRPEAEAMKKKDVKPVRRNLHKLISILLAMSEEARRHFVATPDGPVFAAVPYLVAETLPDRLEGLAFATDEARRLKCELQQPGARVPKAMKAYRALRTACSFAAEHVPGAEAFAEGFERVVDDYPWSSVTNRHTLASASYDLCVFASEHKEVLAKVPGALETIAPAARWVSVLRSEKDTEAWGDLIARLLTLALIEQRKLSDAARYLWRSTNPELRRAFTLPSTTRSANPEAEPEEAVAVEAQPTPSADLPANE